MRTDDKNKGFTLIELLVVLLVLIIMIVLIVPSFVAYLQNNRLAGVGQQLYYSLVYARTEAIKRNTKVYVSVQTGANWCYGINTGATCTCSTAGNCNLGSVQGTTNQNLTLASTGLTANSFSFEPTHGETLVTGTLTFTNNQANTITVEIGLLGGLQLCSAQLAGYQACTGLQ